MDKNNPLTNDQIMEYEPDVKKIAERMYKKIGAEKSRFELKDLKQEGFMGLLEAFRTFDKNRNVKFRTHAWNKIQFSIIDHLRKHQFTKIPKALKEKSKKIKKVKEKLRKQLERSPDDTELSKAMGCSIDELYEIMSFNISFNEMDESISSSSTIIDEYQQKQIYHDMDECIELLQSTEDKLLFVFRRIENIPLKNIAKSFGVSHETIRRKEKKIVAQFKKCIRQKESLIDDFQYLL